MRLIPALALTALAVAGSVATAQPVIHGVAPAARATAASPAGLPNLLKLYSTIRSGFDMVDSSAGPSLSGGMSGNPLQYYAVQFKPAVDSRLTRVVLPIALLSGDRLDLSVSLYADAGGVPGAALFTWTGLTPFDWVNADSVPYDCCSYLQVASDAGLPLTGGTPYWIGATTTPESEMSGVWLYNAGNEIGQAAFFGPSGAWTALPPTRMPAVAVYGVAR